LEQLKEAFFNFDIDRDGFISCEDMKVFLMTKGAKMSREEVCLSVTADLVSKNDSTEA
jgi:Ca2+-binding EF-hand superfamily protein